MLSTKTLTTISALFLIFVLSGCSKDNKVTWEYGKAYTFHYSKGDDGIKLLSTIDESVYRIPQLRVKLELTNEGKEHRSYDRSNFVLEDKQGRLYRPVEEYPHSWSLNPLGKDYPQLIYELPAGLESYEFNFCYQEDKEIAYRIAFNPYDTGFMVNHVINMTYNKLINGLDREFLNKYMMDGYHERYTGTNTSLYLARERVKYKNESLNYLRNDTGEIINNAAYTQSRGYDDNNKSAVMKASVEFLQAFEEPLKQMQFTPDKPGDSDAVYKKKFTKKYNGKDIICSIFITDLAKQDNVNIFALTVSFSLVQN